MIIIALTRNKLGSSCFPWLKLAIAFLGNLFCLLLASCTDLNKEASIYGRWQGTYSNKELSFIFNRDKTCLLKFVEKKSNMIDTFNGKYELDFSKKPIPLTIRNIPQLSHGLYSIVQFISHDSIRIAGFSPKWRLRPVSFETGKIFNLKRISSGNERLN